MDIKSVEDLLTPDDVKDVIEQLQQAAPYIKNLVVIYKNSDKDDGSVLWAGCTDKDHAAGILLMAANLMSCSSIKGYRTKRKGA